MAANLPGNHKEIAEGPAGFVVVLNDWRDQPPQESDQIEKGARVPFGTARGDEVGRYPMLRL